MTTSKKIKQTVRFIGLFSIALPYFQAQALDLTKINRTPQPLITIDFDAAPNAGVGLENFATGNASQFTGYSNRYRTLNFFGNIRVVGNDFSAIDGNVNATCKMSDTYLRLSISTPLITQNGLQIADQVIHNYRLNWMNECKLNAQLALSNPKKYLLAISIAKSGSATGHAYFTQCSSQAIVISDGDATGDCLLLRK